MIRKSGYVTLVVLTGLAVVMLVSVADWWEVLPPEPTSADRARVTCDGLALNEILFPPDAFRQWTGTLDDDLAKHYLPYFAAFQEPSLSCGRFSGEEFRFTQFEVTMAPTVVAIHRRDDGSVALRVRQLEGRTWQGPGRLAIAESKVALEADWQRLQRAVTDARFWELPPFERVTGEDGSPWFLEARRNASYHVVLRISPPDGPFRRLGELMLSLARPPLPEPRQPR